MQKLTTFLFIYYGIGDVVTVVFIIGILIRDFSLLIYFSAIAVVAIISMIVIINLYINQQVLIRSRFGKELKAYLGDRELALEALDQMDYEINFPVYSDVNRKGEAYNFMITRNWVIGCGGITLARPTAMKVMDISSMKPTKAVIHRRAHIWYYYGITIQDREGNDHDYYMRDENFRDRALMQLEQFFSVVNDSMQYQSELEPSYNYFANLTEADVNELRSLVMQERKILAIKICKEKSGAGLKEAKEFVERLT